MNTHPPLDPRVTDQLSAYLDGAQSPQEKAALERALAQDAGLRQALNDLRSVRDQLRSLPLLHPPRSLILTPEMAGLRPAAPRNTAWPFALGSALAALAFVLLVSRGLLTGQAGGMSALPAAVDPVLMMEVAPAAPAEAAGPTSPPVAMGAPAPAPTGEAYAATDSSATETSAGKLAATPASRGELLLSEEPPAAPQPLRLNGAGPEVAPVPDLAERLEEYRPWLEMLLACAAIGFGVLAWRRIRRYR